MKEYETVWEIFNKCPNNQMRDVFIEEIQCEDPEEYIRQKFCLLKRSSARIQRSISVKNLRTRFFSTTRPFSRTEPSYLISLHPALSRDIPLRKSEGSRGKQ